MPTERLHAQAADQKTGRLALGLSLLGLALFLAGLLLPTLWALLWASLLPLLAGLIAGLMALAKNAGRKPGVWAIVIAMLPILAAAVFGALVWMALASVSFL